MWASMIGPSDCDVVDTSRDGTVMLSTLREVLGRRIAKIHALMADSVPCQTTDAESAVRSHELILH